MPFPLNLENREHISIVSQLLYSYRPPHTVKFYANGRREWFFRHDSGVEYVVFHVNINKFGVDDHIICKLNGRIDATTVQIRDY